MTTLGGLLATRRARLVALLLLATVAITILAAQAAGSSLSYYVSIQEFAAEPDPVGQRWRIGARVVGDSIVEEQGRPVAFDIADEAGRRVSIAYDGVVPNLFGPNAFVVVEGTADAPDHIDARSVIIKHENEFYADEPPEDSPSRSFYTPEAGN
ncbi:MAG: hypothetical protein GEU80_01810 [Dehalococcoidia bacterium]|nr:hypothetical protein [Dehalococcoidia bacterium]